MTRVAPVSFDSCSACVSSGRSGVATALDLGEAGEDLGVAGGGEGVDRPALRFEPEAALALPSGGDPFVGDVAGGSAGRGRAIRCRAGHCVRRPILLP